MVSGFHSRIARPDRSRGVAATPIFRSAGVLPSIWVIETKCKNTFFTRLQGGHAPFLSSYGVFSLDLSFATSYTKFKGLKMKICMFFGSTLKLMFKNLSLRGTLGGPPMG